MEEEEEVEEVKDPLATPPNKDENEGREGRCGGGAIVFGSTENLI